MPNAPVAVGSDYRSATHIGRSGLGGELPMRGAIRAACHLLAQHCGPGLLAGVTVRDWWRILCDNRFAVEPAYWARAAGISACSLFNSTGVVVEGVAFSRSRSEAPVAPPLFILGHWRSGTTYLHNLLARDARFIAPTLYQVLFPRTFRLTEKFLSPLLSAMFAGRRQTDNAPLAFDLPHEDEFAICSLSFCSPYAAMAFPRRREFYQRYLSLSAVSDAEMASWRKALRTFIVNFVGDSGRVPLLKSPTHTCRIALLKDMFPGARFLHVHRHPYAVYQSRRAELLARRVGSHLQIHTSEDPEEEIIADYREMHEAVFRQRGLVAEGQYLEIAYEDLVREPLATLYGVYRDLGLGHFDTCAGAVEQYLNALGMYVNNCHPPLDERTRRRLAAEWRQSFDEWGYAA